MIGPSLKRRFESEKRGVGGRTLVFVFVRKCRGFGHGGALGRIAAPVEEDDDDDERELRRA